jgi:hypothetical protein
MTATAKRGLKLGFVYVALSFVILIPVVVLSSQKLLNLPTHGVPPNLDLTAYFAFLSVPLVGLTGVISATPVSLLFVHDKNNGTLEYLLSMGMDQTDIFRGYLGASLLLGSISLFIGLLVEAATGLASGTSLSLIAAQIGLTLALGYSDMALVSILMSAFSSLQRQPVGFNQPMGIALGALVLAAALVVPALAPTLALPVELVIAAFISLLVVALLFLSGNLIRREKMLP